MPYIPQDERNRFDYDITNLAPQNAGQLNYIITQLCRNYIKNLGENYQHYNDILGALEGCKLELYRRSVAEYEDKKIDSNGDL